MIKYNENIIEELKSWQDEDYFVIADFDRTLSSSDSVTSWGIFGASQKVPKEFNERERELYNFYRPIEIDKSIPFAQKSAYMTKWWSDLIMSLKEFAFSESDIKHLMTDSSLITFRQGAKEYLRSLAEKGVPLIIMSAGLGDTIMAFLEQNGVLYPNIYVVSNFLNYENGLITGIKGDIIHSLNKSFAMIPLEVRAIIQNRPHAILLGDQITDVNMLSEERKGQSLKVAFVPNESNSEGYEECFDVLSSFDTSFGDLSKEIPIFSANDIKR